MAKCYVSFEQKKSGGSLPGLLYRTISSVAIESVSTEVSEVYTRQASGCSSKSRKGKKPRVYSGIQRAEMGKLLCRVGATERNDS